MPICYILFSQKKGKEKIIDFNIDSGTSNLFNKGVAMRYKKITHTACVSIFRNKKMLKCMKIKDMLDRLFHV